MSDKPQLSPEEIDTLFRFVERKRVRYRDVQYEIVDHLATAIEEIQYEDPEITFDDALTQVYGRFPVTGFAEWVSEKQKEMQKYWSSRTRQWVLQYFRWPELMNTAGLTGVIFMILYFSGITWIILSLVTAWVVVAVSQHKVPFRSRYKNKVVNEYLVVQSFFNAVPMVLTQSFGVIVMFISGFRELRNSTVWNEWYVILLLSLILAFHCIVVYAANFVFPRWLEEELKNKYAHLNVLTS